jgi:glycosyltransferase involved in cell wall biosynthesis
MLKINVFTYVFWPEQFLVNEFVEDISQKHEIQVLTGLPNYPKGDFFPGFSIAGGPYEQKFGQAKIRRYPIVPRKKGFVRLMINYLTHAAGGLYTQYYLQKADWAFVFATSPITTALPAILWAKLNNAKVCIWLQDLWPDSVAAVGATERTSLVYKILGLLVSWIYKRTDLMLIQSPGFADNLKEFNYKGPTYVVPNWAQGLDFEDAETPAWLKDIPKKFTVTFAGNVGKAQAIDTVIGAAQKLSSNKNIQFVIVGDGSELERVQNVVRDSKLENVFFLGRRPIVDMPGLFKASDALLVSLKKDPIFARTIPSKVQAYMAAGKPLIGSLDGVGSEVIKEAQSGFSAAAEDVDGLAQAILKTSELSQEKRLELGNNARSYFLKNYQKDLIIGQILAYLEKHK